MTTLDTTPQTHSTRTGSQRASRPRAGRRRADAQPPDSRIAEARTLVEDALRFYHASGRGRTGEITALDLARNVHGWTHTTRLRDFLRALAATRKARS